MLAHEPAIALTGDEKIQMNFNTCLRQAPQQTLLQAPRSVGQQLLSPLAKDQLGWRLLVQSSLFGKAMLDSKRQFDASRTASVDAVA